MIVTSTAVEMQSKLQKLAMKGPIQPCVLVVGTLLDPKQIMVFFDNIKYKMFSAMKAIDTCFKIYHVFNVEQLFYNIKTKQDKTNYLIKQVINELG